MAANAQNSPPTHGFAAYRRVLRAPHALPLALASTVARMPVGMGAVALILYVHGATGSFSAAGIVAAAFTIGLGVTGPLLARLIDRRGSGLVIGPGGIVAAAALVAVVLIGHSGAGTAAMAVAAAIAGGSTPPVGGVLRQRLPNMVDADDNPTAYAIDSILIEVVFITGPVLAGLLTATAGAGTALVVAAGLGGLGSLWFAAIADEAPAHEEESGERSWAGALASPALRYLVLTGLPIGGAFGALDVALPAFGAEHGSAALGGPFAAALAVGSALGGIAYGARPHFFGSPTRSFLLLGGLQALTCLPILLVASIPAMFLAAALAGICVAPLITVRSQLTGLGKLAGTGTEAFTWLSLAITVGASAGSALAGPLVESGGWHAGAIAACAITAAGALLAFAGRGLIPRADAEQPSAQASGAVA